VLLEGTLARKKPNPKLTSASSVAEAPALVRIDAVAEPPAADAALSASPVPTNAAPGGAAQARRWAPNAPFTVGRYRLEQELALGAYGATFSGRDLEAAPTAAAQQAARSVHVTLFHPAYFAEPRRKAQRERIERAVRYDNPYVAPTYAVGEAHDTMWAATAPIVGVPLTHWRRDAGAIKPDDVYRIVGQLLDGVAAIHLEGGVHGSLSPETVRIVHETAWVTSPWWLEPAEVPTGEVQPLRTAWMAPELLFGEHADGAATDIYGIGLALGYLLACGLTEPGHSLLVQGIDVPPAVDDVYVRATSRQKGSRYQDVASFRGALEAAAGFEWRDAQKALRRGAGTGLVGLEVLEAGPVRPRSGPANVPPALPPRGNSGLLPLKPVVLSAMPVPMTSSPSSGPFAQPAIVATESVLHSVSGRSALNNEVERTSEDEALPAFEADGTPYGARALMEAAGQSFGPVNPVVELAPDVVTSAPTIPDAPAESAPAALRRGPPDPSAPYGRRTASRVATRTLQHGAPRFGSGLAPVLEVDFRRATPEGSHGQGPLPLQPQQVDATDALPPIELSEEMLRSLMEAPELSAPPPLPGQTRPRWNTGNPNWGSSLEALDADGPSLRLGASLPDPPPISPAADAVPVEAFVPDLPPLPAGPTTGSRKRVTGTVIGMPRVDLPTAGSAVAEIAAPPSLPVATAPLQPGDAYPDEALADDGSLSKYEPTVVEAIAPALLEVDVFAAKPLPAQVDLFAPPPTLPPDPWSDSPLVVTRGEGSSANLHIDSLPVLDKAPSSRRETRPTPAQSPAVAAAAAVAATLDKSIARGPSPTRPAARVQLATPTHTTPSRDEPRVIRDPSGPLSGGAATLSGMPIRGDGPMMRTDGSMVAPVAKRRPVMLWLVLGAVAVGAVVAFFAITSNSGSGSGHGGNNGASGELASVGPSGLGGSGAIAGVGAGAIPVAGDSDAQADGGENKLDVVEAGAVDTAGVMMIAPDVVDVADVSEVVPDTVPDTGINALVPPLAEDAVSAVDAAIEATPADTSVAIADTKSVETPEVVVAEVADVAAPTVAEVSAPSAFTPKDPAKLRCPDGMSKLKKKVPVTLANGTKVEDWEVVCIDRFEFPGAGAVPRTGVDLSGARAACIGKSKRLCTRSEWRRACGGQYPYGKDYDPDKCNSAGADGTPHALASAGSKKGCMSPSGAFDMVGNAAEWTSDGTVNGGTSLKNGEDGTCNSGSKRAGGAPHVGFRCCVDAKD